MVGECRTASNEEGFLLTTLQIPKAKMGMENTAAGKCSEM